MRAALSLLQTCPLSEERFSFPPSPSRTSMRCHCRLARACFFFFCLSFCPSALPPPAGLAFPSPGSSAALGFAHNWLSQLQQGRSGALLVSVSLLIPQNCKQGRTRAFSCPGHVIPHFPLRGKAGLFPKMRCPSLPDSLTTAPHGFNRADNTFCWCRSPTWPSKPHTGPHRAESGFHFLFLVRFFCGRPANCRSRW